MQRVALGWRRQGTLIAFVPTMGYLHEGHLSLVRRARKQVGGRGRVVVSIYVNPTQFGPGEDLSRYPRDLARDKRLCASVQADVLFLPDDAGVYPGRATGEYSTYVVEETLSRGMEGASRPTHFRGVTTVVAKLFNMVQPHWAVFGEKDFQQAAVVRRMVADLNVPVKVLVAKTVREPDGLAMSSRNRYLSSAERIQAVALSRALRLSRAVVRQGPVPASHVRRRIMNLLKHFPLGRLDYAVVFDERTLKPVRTAARGHRLALAVRFGRTCLIDNGRL